MKQSLKILLTTHHLLSYQGTENFTFVIADHLRRNGHQVTVYSAYVGDLKRDFQSIGIPVVSDLSSLKNCAFDIAHVHHQINACELRYYFPELPIVLFCHGIIFLENPPCIDLKVSQYLATSERVKKHMMTKGIDANRIRILRNMVDKTKFFPSSSISTRPQKALILSNKIDFLTETVIKKACKALNIKTIFIGTRFRNVAYQKIPRLINQADLVFSLGRGVIESMFCARIPIIFDSEGGDGMVTPSNLAENMTCNFSGNIHNARYNVESLVEVIQAYDSKYGKELCHLAHSYFEASRRIHDLIAIYYEQINNPPNLMEDEQRQILASYVSSILETRHYMRKSLQALHPFLQGRQLLGRLYHKTKAFVRFLIKQVKD